MVKNILQIKSNNITKYLDTENIKCDNKVFEYILNLSGEKFREVKSRSTIRVDIGGGRYFIKKHYPVSVKEIIKNLVSLKSPFVTAINERDAILRIKELDIKTLDIAGYGINKNIIGQSCSFLITEAIEPNINLDEFCAALTNNKDYYLLKRALIKFIAENTRKMHLNGLNHRDYYLCHYLLKLDNLNVKDFNGNLKEKIEHIQNNIYLIDLHRMQIRQTVPDRYIIKDLSELLFSVRNLGLTRSDYGRFIKFYIDANSTNKNKFKSFIRKEQRFIQKIINKANSIHEKG